MFSKPFTSALSAVREADVALLVIDVGRPDPLNINVMYHVEQLRKVLGRYAESGRFGNSY